MGEMERRKPRQCTVKLWRCDFDSSRSPARGERDVPAASNEHGAPAAWQAAGQVQENAEKPATVAKMEHNAEKPVMVIKTEHNTEKPVMVIKTEYNAEDTFTTQEPDTELTYLGEHFVTYTNCHIKKEDDSVLKMEYEVNEVMVKQELVVEPTVLQPPRAPRAQTDPDPRPSTSSGGGIPAPPHRAFASPTPQLTAQEDNCKKYYGGPSKAGFVLESKRSDDDCQRALSERSDDCTGCEDTADVKLEGGQQYQCYFYRHTTTRKPNLINHLHRHTGEKLWKCQRCEYSASTLGTLKEHMRTHTGKKPYKCEHCEHSAYRIGDLNRHKRTHTGKKPYKCEQCEYSASRVGELKKHMYTHTGEKPYKCELCEYSTSHLGNLKIHIYSYGEKTV